MSEMKDIHIVFKVMNFIKSEESRKYGLKSDEQILLITLASHHGQKGIYPAIPTLAQELKCSTRSIIRIIKKLEDKSLIYVQRSFGISNHYELIFLQKLSTTSDTVVTGDKMGTSDNVVTTPVTNEVVTSDNVVTQSDRRIDQKNRIETRASERAPTIPFFEPDEHNRAQADRLGVDLVVEVASFCCKRKGNFTQQAFTEWLKQAARYKQKYSKGLSNPMDLNGSRDGNLRSGEPKQTSKFWGPGHSDWERMNGEK